MRVSLPLWITLAAALAGCSSTDHREHTLQGQILSISADRKSATIKHEAIKNLMPGMTMPYKVRDVAEFANLQPGDLITSTLVIVSNDAYLERVRKVGDAPLEKPPEVAAGTSSGFELLKPGEQVPNTSFIDQQGVTRTFASFKNKTVVLTFIYTKCPMPAFCPLMDRQFKSLQDKLSGDAQFGNVHLVSVSFDPATDTPSVLKEHGRKLGADAERWTFLTGNRDDIDQFASRFGVSIARNLNDPLDITHNLRTAIIDAEGRLVKAYTGNEWTPELLLTDLKQTTQRQSAQ